MEELKIGDICNSDEFLDASDEFTFFDCIANATESEEEESVGSSKLSQLDSLEHQSHEAVSSKSLDKSEPSFPDGLRRRSSFRLKQRGVSGDKLKDSNCNSPLISETSHVREGDSSRERRIKTLRALDDQEEKVCEKSDSSPFRLSSDEISGEKKQNVESSSITSANQRKSDVSPFRLSSDEISGETKQNVESSSITSANQSSPAGDLDNSSSSFLIFVAELVIKAISFQLNIFVKFFTFPVLVLYFSFLFATNPCRTLNRAKRSIKEKLLSTSSVIYECVSPYLNEHFKGQKSIGNLVVKFGWGFFWSVYVGLVLFGFLIAGFVIGGLMIRYLVEEPLQMTGDLNFDYTKPSPVALVPIISCPTVSCGVNCKEKVDVGKYVGSHVIPPNHRLQLTVSLTLPESEYNKNLGIFQVRVELLSSNGKVLGSSKHPCMLQFKSQPIIYLETFLKSVPLLAGYSSEAQVLNLNMRGFTEGYEPTSCIRVILEQRAEYRPGAGIPEIYSASLVLKSELPIYKRILWYWKKTIFIWISMTLFFMELVLVLIFCRPIIIPRPRPSDGSTGNNGPQNTITQVQGS